MHAELSRLVRSGADNRAITLPGDNDGPVTQLRVVTLLDRSIKSVHVDVDDFPHDRLTTGTGLKGLRSAAVGVPFRSRETVFATPAELPAKPSLTFASAWPVRGSAWPANSRAAAVRVGAVLLFFQA